MKCDRFVVLIILYCLKRIEKKEIYNEKNIYMGNRKLCGTGI